MAREFRNRSCTPAIAISDGLKEYLSMPSDVQRYLNYQELSVPQRQDVRASQRTFYGAYVRTALAQLTFGLVILRLFSKEFVPVGTVYTVSAIFMVFISLYQRHRANTLFLRDLGRHFRTSGDLVLLAAVLAIGAHIALFILIIRLPRPAPVAPDSYPTLTVS